MFPAFCKNNYLKHSTTDLIKSTVPLNAFTLYRGGSRAAAISKMVRFVIIVNGWKLLTIITKRFILNVAAALDLPLLYLYLLLLP